MKSRAFVVEGLPGATHREAFRIRSMDKPPRQRSVTPAPSSPDSVAEPSPRGLERPPSPAAAEGWCPAKAFATLTMAALVAGANGAGLHLGCTRAGEVTRDAAPGVRGPARAPWPEGGVDLEPARPRPWWSPAGGSHGKDFDATLGYPGEGPQLPRTSPSLKTETLTLVTANVTSWSTGTDAGVLGSDAEVLILQEVKLREDSCRAAKAHSRRHNYHGLWAPAKRIGPCGPASGGLATLVCENKAFRPVAPECSGPNWSGARWTDTAMGAGGTQIHVINVYGWPLGTPDLWKNQNALWKKKFSHIAGLRNAPWIMAGDWNATPDQLWVPALAPRAAGWLPDIGSRQPTCFPVKGEPTEKDLVLVSHCLRGAVTGYDFLPVGVLPTHKAVKLTLRLAALREPVRTLRKPRTIPHPEGGAGEPQDERPAPWARVEAQAVCAQQAWDAWTKAAEDWLLRRAGIPQKAEEPYRGRGAPPVVRMRMPLPIATHQQHGEVHGRAKAWTAQANRYRE